MKRREFIKTLVGAIAGVFVPQKKTIIEEDLGVSVDLAKGQDYSAGALHGTDGMIVIDQPLTEEDIARIRDKWGSIYTGPELWPGETAYGILYNWSLYFDGRGWDIHMSTEKYIPSGVLLSCVLTRPDGLLSGEGRVVGAERRDDLWHLHIKGTSLARRCAVPPMGQVPYSLRVTRIVGNVNFEVRKWNSSWT